jgi:hypothetical protein
MQELSDPVGAVVEEDGVHVHRLVHALIHQGGQAVTLRSAVRLRRPQRFAVRRASTKSAFRRPATSAARGRRACRTPRFQYRNPPCAVQQELAQRSRRVQPAHVVVTPATSCVERTLLLVRPVTYRLYPSGSSPRLYMELTSSFWHQNSCEAPSTPRKCRGHIPCTNILGELQPQAGEARSHLRIHRRRVGAGVLLLCMCWRPGDGPWWHPL